MILVSFWILCFFINLIYGIVSDGYIAYYTIGYSLLGPFFTCVAIVGHTCDFLAKIIANFDWNKKLWERK